MPVAADRVRIAEVPPSCAEAEYCLSRYFAELAARFEGGFDAALSLAPTLDDFAPPNGSFLVMRVDGSAVGCGGFKRDGDGIAYIKRMWISGDLRGRGSGKLLLEALETRARELGYSTLRLETEKSLTEARQLYLAAGYREVPPFNSERYAHHWFEKQIG
jgi:GNAT superfamily N-acetyltransferase